MEIRFFYIFGDMLIYDLFNICKLWSLKNLNTHTCKKKAVFMESVGAKSWAKLMYTFRITKLLFILIKNLKCVVCFREEELPTDSSNSTQGSIDKGSSHSNDTQSEHILSSSS